mmetsp:Transcript_27281/g.38368  ORF Transcript_27281/g.38368 Transcript_27281/m.38368 type:complete len:356 (+) Transcript_27281:151-1218(+)
MKIFGKRTKKKSASTTEEESLSEADRIVQELLRQDPNELNAKQRRIVRRYKERIAEEEGSGSDTKSSQEDTNTKDGPAANSEDNKVPQKSHQVQDVKTEEVAAPQAEKEEEKDDTPSNDNNVSSDSNSSSSAPEEEDEKEIKGNEDLEEEEKGKDDNSNDNAEEANASQKADKEEVLILLEGLNSKQRRKLARQLEREGDDALNTVRDEALRLKKEADDANNAVTKEDGAKSTETCNKDVVEASTQEDPVSGSDTKTTTKKGKKRKADWSDLPAEERFRREEQRRKQQEAAERREREANDPNALSKKFKHPLNSERRRANRRKPKWARKSQLSMERTEHDTSGFHMRKIAKAGQN